MKDLQQDGHCETIICNAFITFWNTKNGVLAQLLVQLPAKVPKRKRKMIHVPIPFPPSWETPTKLLSHGFHLLHP